jgi:hypothetical protein
MPKYLDFNTTKEFRDKMLSRTLDPVYGKSPSPKTFTSSTYSVRQLGDSQNLNLPNVDANRKDDLVNIKKSNIFKPNEYMIKDTLVDLPRRANLSLYPYFTQTNDGLIGIMTTNSYDTESELFKFAAKNIKTNTQGPVLARIQQNLTNATTSKFRILDALKGNTTTLINIIRGKEPLIEGNNKITVSRTIVGKGIDFLGTVAGTQLPFSIIPGDYLSNPRNPVNLRPTDVSSATKAWQDLTGVLGSLVGIDRRNLPSQKPSDLLIEHMGSSSKNRLFDLLSYSKYAPNYSTTARSQQSTRLFQIPSLIGQGVRTLLGTETTGTAYIGDDRANDVKQATTDLFSGRKVKSSYYLTLMFDPISAELFHTNRGLNERGPIGGQLTWISKSRGEVNDIKTIGDSLSTKYNFRKDSILETTQQILDSKPQNGGDSLTHIGRVLDQTSKYFKEGDTLISRGSAVRYVDNSGRDIGIEYARVWTKDRPYLTYGNTAPLYKETVDRPFYSGTTTPYRRTNVRRFDGSVLDNTWNLNIAPMSDGSKGFGKSTNIKSDGGKGFYAKKYMLSIENLAWKSSTISGFTVSDLPYSERGNNGGRVMWFPPYDLKVSEQNTANWDKNSFLGRPEPIYTYQNTERSGQLSFKIVVDHPSILNLMVREHFKNMSDEDVDIYLNSFFAGAKDIDFYSLIRTYTNLDSEDVQMIQSYLNSNGDTNQINRYRGTVSSPVTLNPNGAPINNNDNVTFNAKFYYAQNEPEPQLGVGKVDYNATNDFINIQDNVLSIGRKNANIVKLSTVVNSIATSTDLPDVLDRKILFNTEEVVPTSSADKVVNDLEKLYTDFQTDVDNFKTTLTKLREDLEKDLVDKDIVVLIGSTSSGNSPENENYILSIRRSHSVVKSVLTGIGASLKTDKWKFTEITKNAPGTQVDNIDIDYSLSELGFKGTGRIYFRTTNYGEKVAVNGVDCSKVIFSRLNNDLNLFSPISYGCRQSTVSLEYKRKNKTGDPVDTNIQLTQLNNLNLGNGKPPIDVMKRIIMKTLSEEYYFKMLEETSPLVFGSLKEKLKYFHPGFHSMTPEGLNSRLTFLQQCLRPGNTIPVKGLSDDSDLNARNTSFGPPPICVLRVGDFYHSKVIFRDLNITFEDTTWDLNPEGIGVQPMIANVSLQVNFIGGQGLEKPIQRLQNALSSNFYANTEMYDERSESTTTTIGGQKAEDFTKSFLQSLNDANTQKKNIKDKLNLEYVEGQYFGEFSGQTALNYSTLIDDLHKYSIDYLDTYETLFSTLLTNYGPHFTNYMLNNKYRDIKNYVVNTNNSDVENLTLFGIFKANKDYNDLSEELRQYVNINTTNESIGTLFKLNELVPNDQVEDLSMALANGIGVALIAKVENMSSLNLIKDFEEIRDNIIKTLDKLNFITKNGYDVKLENGVSSSVNLTSFNNSNFYNEYSDCINYIKNNVSTMDDKLNKDIDVPNGLSDEMKNEFTMNSLNTEDKTQIMKYIRDYTQYSDELYDQIDNHISKFLKDPKTYNLRYGKKPKRKNGNPIVYNIGTETVTTTTPEIKQIFAINNTNVTENLNYYKK